MRRLRAACLLSLVFVPAALVLQPRVADACSCIPWPGPVEAAQSVDVVFHGVLVSVADAPKPGKYDIQNKVYTFDVLRTFKGQLDERVNVLTADNDAACGRDYGPVGTEWLIYARHDETGALYDNLCSRTRDFQTAGDDIAELEKHADELDDEPPEPEPPEDPGPAEPEPEPFAPDMPDTAEVGDEEPEPTPKPRRCAVVDARPAEGLAGLLTFGLGLALVRRRRR